MPKYRFNPPPKHNPIEHRLFSHVTSACQGVVFHTVEIAKQFMEKAKTTTGLKVTVEILNGIYENGKKCSTGFIENLRTCSMISYPAGIIVPTLKADDFGKLFLTAS